MSIFDVNQQGQLPIGPTDWFYRNLVPKEHYANLEFRRQVLEMCRGRPDHQADVFRICSRDILFYLNVFGWTLNPRLKPPLRPFITYEYQDRAILKIQENLGKKDIAVPKSRDMGASWVCLLSLEHAWHFDEMLQFLLTSEKEELVDGSSEKALFKKLDFWWKHLPAWLLPAMHRKKMHAGNRDTASAFDGEATVEHMGTGDRRTAILLDEASKMRYAHTIRTATRDVSDCRMFNSTPNGRQGVGQAFYEQAKNPNGVRIFMHWSEHPEKRKGLYRLSADGERTPLDAETYDWKEDYDFEQLTFPPNRKPRSIWYDEQCERAHHNPVEIAQELDIDFVGSTQRLVDPETIVFARRELIKAPMHTGMISVDPHTLELEFIERRLGPVKLWCPLGGDNRPPPGHYAQGVDISSGRNTAHTSESAISIWDRATKSQVLEFASTTTKPEEWAVMAIALCKWFHDAFMVPESNGPINGQFMDELERQSYWNVRRQRYSNVGYAKMKQSLGYHNSDGGQQILGRMIADMIRHECHLRSEKVLGQMLEYEYRAGGNLVHAGSLAGSTAGQGKLHGDVAIAAALGYLGCIERPAKEEVADDTPVILPGSMAYRLERMDAEAALAGENGFHW